jgi:hypothetical protein
MKAPGMVGADETFARVATLIAAQFHTAVGAAVVKHFDAVVDVAHHDHGLTPDLHGEVVADLFDLRLVSAIDPSLFKNVFHFKIKKFLIRVDALVNAVWLNQVI